MDKKRCSKCCNLKPLNEFYKDKSKKSGYKSQCKECNDTETKREYQKEYRDSHKDYYREKHAEYRSRNREKLKVDAKKRRENNPEFTKLYYVKNRERILEYSHKYRKEHGYSKKTKAYSKAYKAKRRGAENLGDKDITLETLYNRSDGICALCGEKCDYEDYVFRDKVFIAGNRYPSIDHIKPLSKGGSHTWDNIQLVHKLCNSIKSNKET